MYFVGADDVARRMMPTADYGACAAKCTDDLGEVGGGTAVE
jgi:hypothetical protein